MDKRNNYAQDQDDEEQKVGETGGRGSGQGRGQPREQSEQFEVVAKNLSYKATEDDIRDFFEVYGEVSRVHILQNNDGRSKGIAFVRFETAEAQNNAVEKGNGVEHLGRNVFVEKAHKRGEQGSERRNFGREGSYQRNDQRNQPEQKSYQSRQAPSSSEESLSIFVGNLSFQTDEQTLEEFFQDCGAIVKSRIIRDRDSGKPKGFGYVDFNDSASVQEAIKLSGQELDGRQIKVDVAISRQKQDSRRGGYGGGSHDSRPYNNKGSITRSSGNDRRGYQ